MSLEANAFINEADRGVTRALGLAWYTCAFGRHRLRFKSGGAHFIDSQILIAGSLSVQIHRFETHTFAKEMFIYCVGNN